MIEGWNLFQLAWTSILHCLKILCNHDNYCKFKTKTLCGINNTNTVCNVADDWLDYCNLLNGKDICI